jgi:hypothetical protein
MRVRDRQHALALALGIGWALATACPAPAQAPEIRPLLSVVAIRNSTPDPVAYRLRWPGGAWKAIKLAPNQTWLHWTAGQGKRPEIRYRNGSDPDAPEETATLYAADFNRGKRDPSRSADGLVYAFGIDEDEEDLVLRAITPLDKKRFKEERHLLETKYYAVHPNLLTNYEVLGPSSEKRTYNCISWSLGITDRWLWPGEQLEEFDRLFAKHGYRRASDLDFRVKKGVVKIALYGVVNEDGTVKCTHAAKQEANGTWTSKLGRLALIRHLRPDDVNGPSYGEPVAIYVKR